MKRENSRYSFVKCTFKGSYKGFHVFFLENNLFHVVYTLCMRWIVFCRGLLYCVIKLFKFYQCSSVHYTSVGICTCTCWIYSKNTVQGVLTSKKIRCIIAMKVKLHNRQSFLKKKIFLYRNENKFYSVDLLKVCRTISHVEKLKPIKSEISHHASNYSNHINHLMTWP